MESLSSSYSTPSTSSSEEETELEAKTRLNTLKKIYDVDKSLFEIDSENKYPGFSIRETIGKGAFGKVYRCVSKKSQGSFALKVAYFEQHTLQELLILKNLPSFEAEAELLFEEGRKHVIDLLGFYIREESPVRVKSLSNSLVTEVSLLLPLHTCELSETQKYVKDDSPLSLERRVDIFLKIVKGVEYLHSLGIIHCDLKPKNILVDDYAREIRIIDFGGCVKLTNSGVVKNCPRENTRYTLWWRPLELWALRMIKPPPTFGKGVDIFALGLIGLWLIFGIDTPCETFLGGSFIRKENEESYELLNYYRKLGFKSDGKLISNKLPYPYSSYEEGRYEEFISDCSDAVKPKDHPELFDLLKTMCFNKESERPGISSIRISIIKIMTEGRLREDKRSLLASYGITVFTKKDLWDFYEKKLAPRTSEYFEDHPPRKVFSKEDENLSSAVLTEKEIERKKATFEHIRKFFMSEYFFIGYVPDYSEFLDQPDLLKAKVADYLAYSKKILEKIHTHKNLLAYIDTLEETYDVTIVTSVEVITICLTFFGISFSFADLLIFFGATISAKIKNFMVENLFRIISNLDGKVL